MKKLLITAIILCSCISNGYADCASIYFKDGTGRVLRGSFVWVNLTGGYPGLLGGSAIMNAYQITIYRYGCDEREDGNCLVTEYYQLESVKMITSECNPE